MSDHKNPSGLYPEEQASSNNRSAPISSEVEKGKESDEVQTESDRDRETHEEELGGEIPFCKLVDSDYSKISVGYARR